MSSTLAIIKTVQFIIDVISNESGLVTTGFSKLLGPLNLQSRGLDEAASRKKYKNVSKTDIYIFIKISYFMHKMGTQVNLHPARVVVISLIVTAYRSARRKAYFTS